MAGAWPGLAMSHAVSSKKGEAQLIAGLRCFSSLAFFGCRVQKFRFAVQVKRSDGLGFVMHLAMNRHWLSNLVVSRDYIRQGLRERVT